MAKEVVFKFKVEVDGKEVEQTINSVDGFQKRISDLQSKLDAAPLGSDKFKQLQKELKATQGAFDTAKTSNQSFLDNLASAPGLLGTVGQSIQGVSKVFGSFNMALKTSFFGILATIIAKVVEKLMSMEGVLDPLTKITDIFSTAMGKLANVVLKPLTFIIEGVALGLEKLGNLFGSLTGQGDTYGDTLGNISEGLDELDDSQAAFELQLQKSNRALQEAREIAADETKSIAERKKALEDAGNLERQLAKENRERVTQRARLNAQQLAAELGFNEERIKAIGQYDAKQLESFTQEVSNFKNLNRDKLNSLLGYIGEVENIAADEAKIGKKVASQQKSLDNQAKADREAAAKDIEAKAKERRQLQIQNIDAEIKLITQFQDQTKVRDAQYYTDLENNLKKYYQQKNELEDKDNKLSKAQREVRAKEQDKAIKDFVANDKKGIEEQVKQRQELYKKLIDDLNKYLQKERADIQAQRDQTQKTELQTIKRNLIEGRITQEQFEQQTLENNKKFLQQKVKDDEDSYNKQKASLIFSLLTRQLDQAKFIEASAELDKNYATQTTNNQISLTDSQLAIDENSANKRKQIAENTKNFLTLIAEQEAKTVIEQRLAVANAVGFVGNLLSQFAGKSKALAIAGILVQQGAAIAQIITQSAQALAVAKANAIKIPAILPPAIPNPAFFVAQANLAREITTIGINKGVGIAAAIAGAAQGIAQINSANIDGGQTQTSQEPRALASGGIVTGPGSSTSDSIPAKLSDGESVINARSTAMFAPLLSAINQAGGGVPFQFGGIASANDMSLQEQSSQIAQVLGSQEREPIKTYVVATDMTSQQMFDRAQKSRSTL